VHDQTFEVKLADGSIVQWKGVDGPQACRRYAENHPGVKVVGWRWPRFSFGFGLKPIIEPDQFKRREP
jgi:hypothetical protein